MGGRFNGARQSIEFRIKRIFSRQPGAMRYTRFFDLNSFRAVRQYDDRAVIGIIAAYFPYCSAALLIEGPALTRSCGFMIGRNETFALTARNPGSAIAGISDEPFISNTMEPDLGRYRRQRNRH